MLTDGAFKAKGRKTKSVCAHVGSEATADAGAFSIVIEGVAEGLRATSRPPSTANHWHRRLVACDAGQILVTPDMLGLFDWTPKFVRRYADMRGDIDRAVASYAADVKARRFPAEVETYFSKKPVTP